MWIGLFGIISIGVAFVIITGGIDLSIGSVIGLVASLLPHALNAWHWSPAAGDRNFMRELRQLISLCVAPQACRETTWRSRRLGFAL